MITDVARGPCPPIPLTVLTGFLGAGKTTLLNRLLKDETLSETAVIVNEYGEIGLDHLLVEHVDDDMVILSTGCLCCTLRGDLIEALEKLLRDLDNCRLSFRRVVIETTGLADPAPLIHTTMVHPYLTLRFRLDGVITVIDALNGFTTLDVHQEAVKQAAVADRLVLTKSDLVETLEQRGKAERLRARLKALNPAAPILDATRGEATPGRLFNCGLYDPATKSADVKRWLAEEAYIRHHAHDHAHDPNRHDDHIRAFTLAADTPIPAATFEMFLELLRSLHGPNLLRFKGIINIAETPETPVVIHGVQHLLHPPAHLPDWPDGDHRSRLVFIVRDIDPCKIRTLFDTFLAAAPALDGPDRAALVDNPLVPFGGMDH